MITSYSLALSSVDGTAIDAFEAEFGVRLPVDYREFLLKQNGGRPLECELEGPIPAVVNDLYGIGIEPGKVSDLASIARIFTRKLPTGYIPIGDTAGGDKFLLAMSGATPNGVFYLEHENFYDADTQSLDDYEGITKIASSFSEFLSLLEPAS